LFLLFWPTDLESFVTTTVFLESLDRVPTQRILARRICDESSQFKTSPNITIVRVWWQRWSTVAVWRSFRPTFARFSSTVDDLNKETKSDINLLERELNSSDIDGAAKYRRGREVNVERKEYYVIFCSQLVCL
jgi:hypothetical protein